MPQSIAPVCSLPVCLCLKPQVFFHWWWIHRQPAILTHHQYATLMSPNKGKTASCLELFHHLFGMTGETIAGLHLIGWSGRLHAVPLSSLFSAAGWLRVIFPVIILTNSIPQSVIFVQSFLNRWGMWKRVDSPAEVEGRRKQQHITTQPHHNGAG